MAFEHDCGRHACLKYHFLLIPVQKTNFNLSLVHQKCYEKIVLKFNPLVIIIKWFPDWDTYKESCLLLATNTLYPHDIFVFYYRYAQRGIHSQKARYFPLCTEANIFNVKLMSMMSQRCVSQKINLSYFLSKYFLSCA